jgi:hypothetical protein
MKVSELEGALLDYWVAKTEGLSPVGLAMCKSDYGCEIADESGTMLRPVIQPNKEFAARYGVSYYSTEWEDGGPIIEREIQELWKVCKDRWSASDWKNSPSFGPTPLIAAMRAYVVSKFGEEVPDILS